MFPTVYIPKEEFEEKNVWNKEIRPMMKKLLTGVAVSRQEHQELCRSWSTFVFYFELPLVERMRSLLEEIVEEARQGFGFASRPLDRYFLESLVEMRSQLLRKIQLFCQMFSVSISKNRDRPNRLSSVTLAQLMLTTWNECMLTPLKPFWSQAIKNVRPGSVLLEFRAMWKINRAQWVDDKDGTDGREEMVRFVAKLHRSHVITYQIACLEKLVQVHTPHKRHLVGGKQY